MSDEKQKEIEREIKREIKSISKSRKLLSLGEEIWEKALDLHKKWMNLRETLEYEEYTYHSKTYLLFFKKEKDGRKEKYVRPIRKDLFMEDYETLKERLESLSPKNRDSLLATRVLYSLQQSINALADLHMEANTSKKIVGMCFEALTLNLLLKLGVIELDNVKCSKKNKIEFSYNGKKEWADIELDILITKREADGHPSMIHLTIKTSTKDRLEKIFLDELINKRFLDGFKKTYAVILHDVQLNKDNEKKSVSVSSTFKRQHYLLFKHIFTESSAELFYLDSPEEGISGIRPFGELINELINL